LGEHQSPEEDHGFIIWNNPGIHYGDMKHTKFKFSNSSTDVYFDTRFSYLKKLVDRRHAVLITDENVFREQEPLFRGWNSIVLHPGEEFKVQDTVDSVIEQLIGFQADRETILVGVGGGVITDLTGYVASVFMRGLRFGFVPTTMLAMVDASIGGKNGIDVGVYKNMVGTIRQPAFLLYDTSLLETLPEKEWINGFAEIIKHACIRDARMFRMLEESNLSDFRTGRKMTSELIQRNARIKIRIVQKDEFERGDRRLLNFGHTLGHALENVYELSHGQAISLGMVAASILSFRLTGFNDPHRVINLLERYGLPVQADYDREKVFGVLEMDKKRTGKEMNYVLLERIGNAVVRPISLSQLKKLLPGI
jgi:3-dehydroquinate synthase